MSHVPEDVRRYVCESCQVIHAGTPVPESGGTHSFEAPDSCGVCDAAAFVPLEDWVHHHG